jgi:Ras-related protein Rab-22
MVVGKKVMILGAVGVGKTSLSHRLAFNKFDRSYKATIGVVVYNANVEIEGGAAGDTMPLVLWDTDGDFGMHIFENTYLRGASAAVIVADATRPVTIPHLKRLVLGFKDRLPGRPCAAILNKADLLAGALPSMSPDDYGSPDFTTLTSALSGDGVQPTFSRLAAIMLRRGL